MSPLQWVAIGVVFAMGAFAQTWSEQILLVCCVGCVASFGMAAFEWAKARRRDRYDLGELQALQEQEEVRLLLEEGGLQEQADTVTCPYCLDPYDSRLPVCPRCQR